MLPCLHTFVSTHVSDHAHKTEELKLKLCKDTAPSSQSDSSSEATTKPRGTFPIKPILLQLPSLWSHHHSFFPTGSYMIPTPCYLSQVKAQRHFPMDKLALQFIYSPKSHLWHQIHSLISFPALRTHLPSHLKCKAKAQPIRDPTAFFLNTGGSVSCPSQASHWAFIFILSTHIPPVGSTRWFILQSCLQGTAGSCYGPDMEMLTNLLHFQVSSPAWRCIYRRLQILCPL